MHDVLDNGNLAVGTTDRDISPPDPARVQCCNCGQPATRAADHGKYDPSCDDPETALCLLCSHEDMREEWNRMRVELRTRKECAL